MKVMCTVVMLVLSASGAGAVEIRDKWGIGAGLFSGGSELSLIRGHSERTAYVFDVVFGGSARDSRRETAGPTPSELESNSNDWRITVGPRLRRFTRPSSEFSPYWDVFASTNYGRAHFSGGPRNSTTVGASTGLGFGLEYFTKWHCSIAAHTSVFRVSWTRFRSRTGADPDVTISEDSVTSAELFIQPLLYLRGYF